jgi:lipopolysaccharide/colanic/teichoic acid biosynthesis glycosyltransferase
MKLTTKFASVQRRSQIAGAGGGPALHAVLGGATGGPSSDHSQAWRAPRAVNDVPAKGRLARSSFLLMIQREKRRADRSHSALSLARIEIESPLPEARDALLEKVCTMVRETDYTAAIDDGGVAVLLPDTGEAGLRSFLDKVALSGHPSVLSVVGATYPDASFDRLIAERMGTAHSRHPVDVIEPPVAAVPGYRLKRALDLVGSVIALVLLLPLMVLVALVIELTSPGPAIFRQQRLGRGGVPFTFYKFRSITIDTDDRIHRDYVKSWIHGENAKVNQQDAPFYKIKSDPRVTWVGKFIRKTSIDELPQLYNVLRGEMSLVGPRPPMAYEAENYQSWHLRRVLEIKPGMTGLWQVEGRSRVTFDDMVRMDLRYINGCSLALDLRILAKTTLVVLSCEGAS